MFPAGSFPDNLSTSLSHTPWSSPFQIFRKYISEDSIRFIFVVNLVKTTVSIWLVTLGDLMFSGKQGFGKKTMSDASIESELLYLLF